MTRREDHYSRVSVLESAVRATAGALRRREGARCVVFARWDLLEPEEGRFDEAALEALRAELIRLGTMEAEPVVCLYRGESPRWFEEKGGWLREDNLRCYLRYIGKVTRAVGHLAEEYITFYEPNVQAWELGSLWQTLTMLSYMACDHIRAVRLIRDTRQQRGLGETSVGFVLRMYAPSEFRRDLLGHKIPANAPGYQRLPLLAMALGRFSLPMRNVLRVQPGVWADFVGVTGSPDLGKREECCAMVETLTGVQSRIMEE